MKQHSSMKSILCILLVMLLALPQCVRIYAEEESEPGEIYSQESFEEETLELDESGDEEAPSIEFQKEEDSEEVPTEVSPVDETENETQEGSSIILTLSETYVELFAGDSFRLEVTLEGSSETEIIWNSDSPDIVSVDESGTISAIKEGVASISASTPDGSVSSSALVKVLPVEPSDIEFEQKSYEIMAGDKIAIPYHLSGENYEDIVWSISDENVAKINTGTDGEIDIQTMSSGVVQVNAQINGISNSFSVVVIEEEDLLHTSTEAMYSTGTSIVNASYSINYNQSSARDLAQKLNAYRVDTANISALTYDYTIEKYAMQRAAEIMLSFSNTRPNGSMWHTVFDKSIYGTETSTNLTENILCTGDGSMATSLQVLNRVLSNNVQRSKSLRTKNRSFGIAHAVYNGVDYWVMLFSDTAAVNRSQTSPVDTRQSAYVKIAPNLYSSPKFFASKDTLKVNVNKSISLPTIHGTVDAVLAGKQKSIAFTNYSVTWSLDSVAKKYASISGGKVIAKNEPNNNETAKLIASINMNGTTYKTEVKLKVIQPVTNVKVLPETVNIDIGKTHAMLAIVNPNNATDKSVTWKSSNTKIATVSANGVVTAKKGGTCKITATTNDGGFTSSSTITVIVHAKDIAFDIGELTMSVGMADKLVPVFTPADTTDKRVTFTSSDPSKVSIAADGTVKALALTGNDPVILTVTSVDGGLSDELPVIVKDKDRVARPEASYLYESTYEIPAFDFDEWEMSEMLVKGDQIKLFSDTKDAEIYYTLDGSDPSTSSTRYTGMITFKGGSLTIKAIAVKHPQMKDSEIATFKFEETEASTWEIYDEDLEKLKGDDGLYHIPPGLWAAGVNESAVYTGNKITFPNIRVYYHNRMLFINEDYKVNYKNNINVCPEGTSACTISYKDDGSYVPAKNTKVSYITITGKGDYKGSTYIPFKILPVAISEENSFSYQDELFEPLTNKTLKPLPIIYWNGKKLKNKTDYVVAYSKDPQGTQILEDGINRSDLPEDQNSGEFYAIISGIKNFTAAEEKFTVPIHVKKDAVLLSKTKIKVQNIEYSGTAIDPDALDLVVTSGKETLVKGTDYSIEKVSPEEIKEIGTYTVTIKASDTSKFVGEKTATFKVTGKAFSKAKVYCLGNKVTYTGNTFQIADLYKYDPKRPDLNSVTLYYGDEKLVEGKDYTIQISGQNKGSGKISFIGIGNYTGTIKKSFTINPKPVSKNDLIIFVADMWFNKSGANPEVYVFLKTDPDDPMGYEISDGVYGKQLINGVDYSLKFFNNKKIYTDDSFNAKNPPSVSVIMKGNYKGTIANNYFLILEEDISYMKIEAADIVYSASKKGTQYYVKPVIYDYAGKKLTLNKDYQLTYYYAQDAKVNGSSTYNRSYGSAIRTTDIPEPGTIIGIKATGMGSYYGELTVQYKVFKKGSSLSAATVKINYLNGKNQYFEYTGAQVIPTAENLKVTLAKKTLTYGVDYEILSVTNNIRAGKATMVIQGLGEYAGTKKVTFSIGKQTLILSLSNLIRSILGI